MHPDEILDEASQQVLDEHAFIHHPFIQAVCSGEASREDITAFARDFWIIPQSHLINNAGKLAHAQLLRGSFTRQVFKSPYEHNIVDLLGESLADELGRTTISPVNHFEPYLDLTDELGIPRQELGDFRLLSPQAMITMYTWTQTALNFSLLELLSSHNFVNDTANVVAMPRFSEALRKHYGLSERAVSWFQLHGDVDVEHGSRAREIIKALMLTEEDAETVRICVRFGLGVAWTHLDGVMWSARHGTSRAPVGS